uniref:MRH domain-containing protein n=1 Tax=Heterosigma akashiwo TaxID=2829 RepID=A0A6S9JZQ1_HETAK|mmetsp:Transcript_24331/g.38389  ORF Transcript_24331/g.38389 Transcript_24331/m.38389 type:complete len:286 (-) Transcript_24331:382-1239(-)
MVGRLRAKRIPPLYLGVITLLWTYCIQHYVEGQSCERPDTHVGGYQYNLNNMKGVEYLYWKNGMHFKAMACPEHPSVVLDQDCPVDDAVAGITSSCYYLGRLSAHGKYQFIDNEKPDLGVKVTYGQGEMCAEYPQQHVQTVFRFFCDDKKQYDKTGHLDQISYGTAQNLECVYQFDFLVQGACPIYVGKGAVPGYMRAAIVAAAGLLAYCALGACVKRRRHRVSGMEMVPHIDCLRWCRTKMYGRNYPVQYYAAQGGRGAAGGASAAAYATLLQEEDEGVRVDGI